MKFHKLRLQSQLILLVGITMIFVFWGMFFATRYLVGELNNEILIKTTSDVNLSIENVVISNAKRLSNLSKTHSNWTELVEATDRNDLDWIHSNATAYLVEDSTYEVDLIYLKNAINGFTEAYGPLPEELYTQMYAHLGDNLTESDLVSFFVTYNESHYVISITPLTNSETTKTYGFMAVGRQVDNAIKNVISEQFKNIADVSVTYIPSKEPQITHLHFDNLSHYLSAHIKTQVSNLQLSFMILDSSNQVIYVILGLLVLGMIVLLYMLLKISNNFRTSIDQIKSITYSDYSTKMNLSFSQDFYELSECINNLSDQLSKRDQDINRNYMEIISILVKTLEEVDYYTKGHSERVSHYSVELAKAIHFTDIETVKLSGLLHDVGKVTVDINILNKPGKLSETEFDEIKKHPVTGSNILEMSSVFDPILDIVKYHHERVDGKGYPEGLTLNEIPVGAKIVALADVFDSLTSKRSYRDPMTVEEALQIIQEGSGTHFDSDLAEVFIQIAPEAYQTWSLLNTPPNVDELILEVGRVMNEHLENKGN